MEEKKSLTFSTFLVLLLSFNLRASDACTESFSDVNIVCVTLDNDNNFSFIGSVYNCRNWQGNLDFVRAPNSAITSITFKNGSAVATANQIEMLDMSFITINFLPTNFRSKLPKLKALRLNHANLLSVNKEIMKQFGNSLEFLDLDRNQLTSLDGNLFENNLKLKYVSFNTNPIRHIDPMFFETLKKMNDIKVVFFMGLSCMNQQFNGVNITTFEWNNGRCFNETARAETLLREVIGKNDISLNNESCLKRNVDDSMKQINENANRNGENLNIRFDKMENLVQDLVDANNNFDSRLAAQENLIDRIDRSLKKTNCRIDSMDQKLERILKFVESME